MKKRSRTIIIAVALALAIALPLTEVILRAIYSEIEVDGSYWGRGAFEAFEPTGYRHTPGFEGRAYRRGEFDVSVKISEFGLRERNLDVQNLFQKTLLVLGDSFSFGLGVEEAQGFPALLQKELNTIEIGVINASQTGYGVAQEAAFGVYLANELKPDQILLCLSLNSDIANDFVGTRNSKSIDVVYGYRLPKDRWLPNSFADYLRTHSYFLMRLGEIQKQVSQRSRKALFEAKVREDFLGAASPTMTAIKELYDYCQARGIVLSIVSVASDKGPSPFAEVIADHVRSLGIPFLDLEEKDFQADDYFDNDGHWNARGHRKATRHILGFLKAGILPSAQNSVSRLAPKG